MALAKTMQYLLINYSYCQVEPENLFGVLSESDLYVYFKNSRIINGVFKCWRSRNTETTKLGNIILMT